MNVFQVQGLCHVVLSVGIPFGPSVNLRFFLIEIPHVDLRIDCDADGRCGPFAEVQGYASFFCCCYTSREVWSLFLGIFTMILDVLAA